ncbi:MAG: winged helix DNA-binding protein [Microlunatus sp.]|nr:winged helix DNA-binding protein [Microlunatus sp.]
MWDYVVLAALTTGPSPTQTELAAATRRDKTRLIRNLDRLEERGLLTRRPDPADRRNRIVELTPAGRQLVADCRADIRAMEEDLLSGVEQRDREGFETTLADLVTETR